jgi:uracil-DNA glycosylase
MSVYAQLLEAVIQHLETLQARGEKYVRVSRDTLAALAAPAPALAAPVRRAAHSGTTGASLVQNPAPRAPLPSGSRPLQAPVSSLFPISPDMAGPAPTLGSDANPVSGCASATGSVEEALAELRGQVTVCQKCPQLAKARKNVVFGVGDMHASLMFVGEAPGADEDEQGEPFVGKAGQLLTRIIQAMGFSRETVYIANILKCRPDTPGQTSGNRKPTSEEMQTCLPYLLAQIELIKPKVMVALGATAVEGLLGLATPISKLRGHFQTFRGVPVMPTYHPSYLLRNQSIAIKRDVWEDMLQVLEKLGCPITEKQRHYFKSAS